MSYKSIFIFAILVLAPLVGSSQIESTEMKTWVAIGPGFGSAFFLDADFTDQFETDFAQSTYIANLRLYGPISERREIYFDLGFYLPQKMAQGDSINYKFSGAYLGIPWQTFRFSLIDGNKNNSKLLFSTPLYLGTDFGWMWLKENEIRNRNFFLNLKIQIEPRLVLFQRLVIGTSLAISYDLTRSEWKNTENYPVNAEDFKNTAFSVNASLGWILRKKNGNKSRYDE